MVPAVKLTFYARVKMVDLTFPKAGKCYLQKLSMAIATTLEIQTCSSLQSLKSTAARAG